MIQLACLGRGYRGQIEEKPDALQGVELYRVSGHARVLLEEALEVLVEYEQIEI